MKLRPFFLLALWSMVGFLGGHIVLGIADKVVAQIKGAPAKAEFISYSLPDGTYCVAIKESGQLSLSCDFTATDPKVQPKKEMHLES